MTFNFRFSFIAGLAVALVIGFYLMWLWQPKRQIRLHTMHFLAQVENKNWAAMANSVDADFEDAWGNDRERLLARLREILSHTRGLKLTPIDPQIHVEGGEATWRAVIRVEGDSGEVMSLIKDRINSLGSSFDLRWRRPSRKPWDWKLTRASNPDLKINELEY